MTDQPPDEPYDAEEDGRRSYALAINELRRQHLASAVMRDTEEGALAGGVLRGQGSKRAVRLDRSPTVLTVSVAPQEYAKYRHGGDERQAIEAPDLPKAPGDG